MRTRLKRLQFKLNYYKIRNMKNIIEKIPAVLQDEWQVNPAVLKDLELAPERPRKRSKRSLREKFAFGERFISELPQPVENGKGESF